MCGAAHAPHEHPSASLHTSSSSSAPPSPPQPTLPASSPSQAGTPGANGNASRLQRTLQHNDGFVSNKGYKEFDTSKRSAAPSIVLTCMDSRLIELLPKAMNFRTGEAKIIKTAGAILTHPFGGAFLRAAAGGAQQAARGGLSVSPSSCGTLAHLSTHARLVLRPCLYPPPPPTTTTTAQASCGRC
jgi:hypothetical protein